MSVFNISDILVLVSTFFVILQCDSVQCSLSPEFMNQFMAKYVRGPSRGADAFNITAANTTSSANDPKLIFEENFDCLNKSRWTREVKIPTEPDYEFCVYHGEGVEGLVEVKEGTIRFKPLMLEDYYGTNTTMHGQLNFSDCTSDVEIECARQAASFFILPPVMSARLSTKNSFSFKYGKIEIRAKFPEGEWIYPEMWLEPKHSIYGDRYASGRILLGFARGNEYLQTPQNSVYDSRRLEFGLRVRPGPNIKEHTVTRTYSRYETFDKGWRGFHTYTTIWTAEGFQFFIDGEEVGRLTSEYKGWFEDPSVVFSGPTRSAPFDEEFYITIGLGVGGIRVFPDHTMTARGIPKPWKNNEAKAMLKFLKDKRTWLLRWQYARTGWPTFCIDYIRVWSL